MSVKFEDFIIQCLKAKESHFRKFMHRILPRYGFKIKEDDYVSDRVKQDESYKSVHNLLAIRGENPRVCLVAHTDVCRDHSSKDDDPIHYGNPNTCPPGVRMVQPVIRIAEIEEDDCKVERRIIQDKTGRTQVGGDDRLGCAINLWIAINTGYDMGLYFPTDEEIGLKSARKVEFPELKSFDLCVEVDRGNHSHELVNKIHNTFLCDYDTTVRLLRIAFDMGKSRKLVQGNGTDVYALKERNMCKNAVNMTCGYHNSVQASGNEYIDISEARDTMLYVSSIIRDYSLDN